MTTYDITTLTENQISLLNGIGTDQFGEGEFGAFFEDIQSQAPEKGIIKTKQQTKATLNQLIRKGIFEVDTTKEEGSSWLTLTLAGGDAISAILDAAPAEDAEEEDEEDLLGDTGMIPIVPAPAAEETEDEDLLGDLGGVEATTSTEDVLDTVTKEQVVSHTENYTVNEWVDADDTEWTETIFADGSRTLKRRREVSGSWRTDYWGAEFSGDKERATTAKLAKMARSYGRFTATPHEG
jgi:hypothetical protein